MVRNFLCELLLLIHFVVIPGCFSVVAALMITLTVIMFKKMRTLIFGLVILQSLSEMIFNLSLIIFWHPPGKYIFHLILDVFTIILVHGNWQCKFQGYLLIH